MSNIIRGKYDVFCHVIVNTMTNGMLGGPIIINVERCVS